MTGTAGRNKRHSTIYYSDTVYTLLEQLSQDTGLTKTAVIEFAIRELAKSRKIEVPAKAKEGEAEG